MYRRGRDRNGPGGSPSRRASAVRVRRPRAGMWCGVNRSLLIVGDVMLDRDVVGSVTRVCTDAPVPIVEVEDERARPGGAGLAALLGRALGAHVTLVTALARDAGADRLREMLTGA